MIRFGVDFGGTKIEVAALNEAGEFVARVRKPNPGELRRPRSTWCPAWWPTPSAMAGATCARLGMGIPGSISPRTGLIRNANSVYLNGRPFGRGSGARAWRAPSAWPTTPTVWPCPKPPTAREPDARRGLRRHPRHRLRRWGRGRRPGSSRAATAFGGEWGHTPPCPGPSPTSTPVHDCWCGRKGCLEKWIAGPAFSKDAGFATGQATMDAVNSGDASAAMAALDRYIDRLGRGLRHRSAT
jgi:fructokinase